MTNEQYDFAIARIKELQNPALQPLDMSLSWELNGLMTQVANYEAEYDQEALVQAESSEWHAFDREDKGWPGDGSGMDDFEDYNQNEGNDW